ncbi:hypothetical protein P8C59_007000 [Phyllachora maydis]|uniref:DNA-directed RNA polymerase n=1 Tax=Phyllachora maydis TaxID=1825666 RepID=A0AAD9MDS4_9PEZI|nr:hypothetical protein P8C59_007000 [Phyllachora maydis]
MRDAADAIGRPPAAGSQTQARRANDDKVGARVAKASQTFRPRGSDRPTRSTRERALEPYGSTTERKPPITGRVDKQLNRGEPGWSFRLSVSSEVADVFLDGITLRIASEFGGAEIRGTPFQEMAPPNRRTETSWDHEYNTLRREKLFRSPPKDHTAYPALQEAVDPHIHSFNAIFRGGSDTGGNRNLLEEAIAEIGPKTFLDGDERAAPAGKNRLTVRYKSVTLQKSQVPPSNKFAKNREILPSECRERHVSYRGKLSATLEFRINEGDPVEFVRDLGQLPIMVKSNKCHLENNSPAQLVQRKEESEELGGYFIVNGLEKVIRLLLVNRRNFPLAITRPSFKNRGAAYSAHGIIVRSVRPDETSQTNVIHYLTDGNVTFRFSWRKNEYLVPVMMILKALVETNDREVFEGLVGRASSKGVENTFLTDRVELLLRTYKVYSLYTKTQTRAYLGEKFRVVLGVPDTMSNYEAGTEFLRKIVLVHLGCVNEINQEILLGGFMYSMILKERLEELLTVSLREALRAYLRKNRTISFTSATFTKDFPIAIFRNTNENIANALEYFLSTGNLQSSSGLDLQQTSGYTIIAEKLNFPRFISHFRSVHRGAFFAQLKTTTITTEPADVSQVPSLAFELGIVDSSSAATDESVVVMLDGKVIGWCTPEDSSRIANTLRYWKVEGRHGMPLSLEIGHVPPSNGGSYPGIYMASKASRLVRPVKHLQLGKEDLIGPHEQPYMSIAVTETEIIPGSTTHVEYDPTNILSILANMTPFSDFNQSPRNMYQCQMAKQTMGTPSTALRYRTDNKMFRLQTGQTPVVRAPLHNMYGFDNFPNGTNAVVAVISYTGYDMDDAMIINKSAHERGFGYGSVYKVKKISLKDDSRTKSVSQTAKMFGFAPNSDIRAGIRQMLDEDGLPLVGRLITEGDYLCAWHTVSADFSSRLVNRDGITHYEKYKDAEDAFVEEVKIIGSDNGTEPLQTISIKLRKWPMVDMPFTESGIQPDIIINPHAFPSRMTIGMFVESLAGKSGCLHGLAQDSTPFRFDEDDTAGDYFGHQLMKAGYNYHGNEPMYSGITGEELGADIYIGVVYYQRLRHMVNDKYQVRTTGPVVPTTGQPIKGRKRGGGIRVGEMERDALLAHGTAFLVQDRLLNCSDYTKAWVCRKCGLFLSTQPTTTHYLGKGTSVNTIRCRNCAKRLDEISDLDLAKEPGDVWEDGQGEQWVGGENTAMVIVPGALKYLDVELAAMGIALRYKVDEKDKVRRGPLKPAAIAQDEDLWTLFLLGVSWMQYVNQTDPASWYGIAGIHSVPFPVWDQARPLPGNERAGYCHHISILFPTWHRSYLALYEQVLSRYIQIIASLWPEGPDRDRYRAAAVNFRIPYWDWATAPPNGDGVLPLSVGQSPFKPLDTEAFSYWPFMYYNATLRAPTTNDSYAQSNNSAVAMLLAQNQPSLEQRIYNLFAATQDYNLFSNEAWYWDKEQTYDSIESVHDTIHTLAGGLSGHMAYIPYSAFDPIFFLHHAMIDRLVNMWQVLYPESWIRPTAALLDVRHVG